MFTTDEWSTVANALRTAADQYTSNAGLLRSGTLEGGARGGNPGPHEGLAKQFDRQAADATALADRICETVGV